MRKNRSLKQLKKIKRVCTYILVIEIFALVAVSSYAWYRNDNTKGVQSVSVDVEKLVKLSLLDDTATQTLQLFVGNLYPGQSNKLVLCISNDPMDGTKRQMEELEYELKLAHTNNLPVEYNLYPLSKVNKNDAYDVHIEHADGLEELQKDTYFEITPNEENRKTYFPYTLETKELSEQPTATPVPGDWINEPVYQVYSQNFKLTMPDGNYDYNYYLLEITMPKTLPDGVLFSDIKKEVDMVYIIATIKQLQ